MKRKILYLMLVFLCFLTACGGKDKKDTETMSASNIIEGTYIVRAAEREDAFAEEMGVQETIGSEETTAVEPEETLPQETVSEPEETPPAQTKPEEEKEVVADLPNEPDEKEEQTENSGGDTTTTPSAPVQETPAPSVPSQPVHTCSYSGTVTTAATCTAAGTKTYTCSCGSSYTESIPATGHHYINDSTLPATCESAGEKYFICDVCWNDSYVETIPQLSHTYGGYVTTIPETCETAGEMAATCTMCNTARKTAVIPARGHSWSTSTYTLNGVKITEVKCSWYGCGAVQSRTEEPIE